MEIHVFAKVTKLHDVVGRVDYVTNPDRQEKLLAVASTVKDPYYWRQLAEDCQVAWRQAGGARKHIVNGKEKDDVCCEAREIILMLPKKVLEMDATEIERLAEKIVREFKEKNGAECVVGIHISKVDDNVHLHLIFSERLRLIEPVVKIADRAAFLDEQGLRRRTRGEILDEHGRLREGCRVVRKGEPLYCRRFGEKCEIFSDALWLSECKRELAEWINREIEPDKRRVVFDPASPYLAQIHVGKGRPGEQRRRIEEFNDLAKKFNAQVRNGMIEAQTAYEAKLYILFSEDRNAALKAVMADWGGNWQEAAALYAAGKKEETRDQKKAKLKRLYREARRLRNDARTATSGLDRVTSDAAARACSIEIDRLRKELELYKEEEYQKALERAKWQRLLWMKRVLASRREEDRMLEEIKDLQNQAGHLATEYILSFPVDMLLYRITKDPEILREREEVMQTFLKKTNERERLETQLHERRKQETLELKEYEKCKKEQRQLKREVRIRNLQKVVGMQKKR